MKQATSNGKSPKAGASSIDQAASKVSTSPPSMAPPVTAPYGTDEWMDQVWTRDIVQACEELTAEREAKAKTAP